MEGKGWQTIVQTTSMDNNSSLPFVQETMVQLLWVHRRHQTAVSCHVSQAVELEKGFGFRNIGHTVAICIAIACSQEAPLTKHHSPESARQRHLQTSQRSQGFTHNGKTPSNEDPLSENVLQHRGLGNRIDYLTWTFQASLQNILNNKTGQNGFNKPSYFQNIITFLF